MIYIYYHTRTRTSYSYHCIILCFASKKNKKQKKFLVPHFLFRTVFTRFLASIINNTEEMSQGIS